MLAAAVWLVRQVRQRQHAQAGLMGNLLFNYLHPGSCTLEWGPKDSVVGKISTITVRHFRGNGLPWQCTTDDPFQFRITGPTDIKASVQFDGNVRTVSFTTRQSGTYTISVLLRGRHVSGSPFAWDFRAAQIDVSKCSVQPTLVTAAEEVYTSVIVRACDRFQNFVPSADFCLSMVWAKQKGVCSLRLPLWLCLCVCGCGCNSLSSSLSRSRPATRSLLYRPTASPWSMRWAPAFTLSCPVAGFIAGASNTAPRPRQTRSEGFLQEPGPPAGHTHPHLPPPLPPPQRPPSSSCPRSLLS